jgi:hypothetical protein
LSFFNHFFYWFNFNPFFSGFFLKQLNFLSWSYIRSHELVELTRFDSSFFMILFLKLIRFSISSFAIILLGFKLCYIFYFFLSTGYLCRVLVKLTHNFFFKVSFFRLNFFSFPFIDIRLLVLELCNFSFFPFHGVISSRGWVMLIGLTQFFLCFFIYLTSICFPSLFLF